MQTINETKEISFLHKINSTLPEIPHTTTLAKNFTDNNFIFPKTRYQGSKYKLSDWIWESTKFLEFESVLDAFGGTASISHMFKCKNKTVHYNDILKFNSIICTALIENSFKTLTLKDMNLILNTSEFPYKNTIEANFKNLFYTDSENIWLDRIVQNINLIEDKYKKSLAFFALFQSCISKRPYNLFHRANLYIRTADVQRSFGNKTTWDKPFETHFLNNIIEANNAIFSNDKLCKSTNLDALEIIDTDYDLVYIDPPYVSEKGSTTNYLDYYHFLEGISNYNTWEQLINKKYKHYPIRNQSLNLWTNKNQTMNNFSDLFCKFQKSILVVSYRSDGIPAINDISCEMKKFKKNVKIVENNSYKYVLSKRISGETLIIGY